MVIHFDAQKKTSFLQAGNRHKDALNKAYKAYLALGLGDITLDELTSIGEPDTYLRSLIFERSKELKALPIERSFALQMIKLPEQTPLFFQAFVDYKRAMDSIHNPEVKQERFYRIENDEVVTTPDFIEFAETHSTTNTRNKKDEEIFTQTKDLFEKLRKLQIENPQLEVLPRGTLSGIISRGQDGIMYYNPLSILR